jgi:hypothetical protein
MATTTTTNEITILPANQIPNFNLDQWSEFVATCFSHKSPPPIGKYFLDKCTNDSLFTLSNIFIAMKNNLIMVGTLRIFSRIISGQIWIGIGEVSVDVTHRRQGIAKLLVTYATMNSIHVTKPKGFYLHASELGPQQLYLSIGFQFTPPRLFVQIQLPHSSTNDNKILSNNATTIIRPASFPQDSILLHECYQKYNNIPGTASRDLSYWQNWVPMRWQRKKGICMMFINKNNECLSYVYGYMTTHEQPVVTHHQIILDEIILRQPDDFKFLANSVVYELIQPSTTTHYSILIPEFVANRFLSKEFHGPIDSYYRDNGWMISNHTSTNDISIFPCCEGVYYDTDSF